MITQAIRTAGQIRYALLGIKWETDKNGIQTRVTYPSKTTDQCPDCYGVGQHLRASCEE